TTRAGEEARESSLDHADPRRVDDGVGPELRRITGTVVSRHLEQPRVRLGADDRRLRPERIAVPGHERAAADRWPGWRWTFSRPGFWLDVRRHRSGRSRLFHRTGDPGRDGLPDQRRVLLRDLERRTLAHRNFISASVVSFVLSLSTLW